VSAPRPRDSVASLQGYSWEEPTESIAARFGLDPRDVVRFDTNTVPWQPAVESAATGQVLNEYPDTSYRELVEAIAAYCGRPARSIVVGAGADELLGMCAQAYLERGRAYALSRPTYSYFDVVSGIAGASAVAVDCRDDLGIDQDRLRDAAGRAQVTWLANPDNPTGGLLSSDDVLSLARASAGLLVVDEAYAEFVAPQTALDLLDDAPNLAVVRTFSKAFGLAGARVGYLVAGPDVVAALNAVRPPNSVSATSAALAVAALGRVEAMRSTVGRIVAGRASLAEALRTQDRTVIEGAANFVLATISADETQRALRRGLVLRTFAPGHRLAGFTRITVRSPEENARLLQALQQRD